MTCTDDFFGYWIKNENSFAKIALSFMKGVINMLSLKEVYNSEKETRHFNNDVEEVLIRELMRDDITQIEKESVFETIKEQMIGNNLWECNNSRFWYRVGLLRGRCSVGLAVLGGFAVGCLVDIIKSKD